MESAAITTSTLADKGILVSLHRKMWGGYRLSKTANGIVESDTQRIGVGNYNKKLLSTCPEFKACKQRHTEIYEFVRDATLPWMDDGVRLIPAAQLIEFKQDYDDMLAKCEQAVSDLAKVWDSAVLADAHVLGKLYCPDDYPSKDDMIDSWHCKITFAPVPNSGDFRVEMSEEDKRILDESVAEHEKEVTKYLLEQLMEPITAMATKLKTKHGDKGGTFRNTLVSNVCDVIRRARRLNINSDERIDAICSECEKALANVNADTLRESPAVRESVCNKMSAVRSKMSAYF